MSRIGNAPVTIPKGVTVTIQANQVAVKGPKGELKRRIEAPITIEQSGGEVLVKRPNDENKNKALHGLMRALVANMVKGVTEGYERKLELHGVGYRASVQGAFLQLECGLSHIVRFPIPDGIQVTVDKAGTAGGQPMTPVSIKGIDNILVGDVAARIRIVRPPEPYQGKGIRYSDEHVRRKEGKKAG